ncbi:hypothetical protein ABIA33_002978 [Streptacidiphilus sp. MAP12-16]|uniref:DUF6191 domain-containing protein n=1 Tax=Streptacidiphilus sp. MAP12-16 TaxID=3156300 RepID=UPI003511613E
MSILQELFSPGRRHTEDERNRLEWTRDEEGVGDPHHGPIDLESGRVVIRDLSEQQERPAEP